MTPDEVVALCDRLDPDRTPGRLTLITRMGASAVAEALPPLLEAVRSSGHPVVWACDPMHGNTFVSEGGRKTRRFDDILAELKGFFAAHHAAGTWPGGVHVELTGDDVTECLGGFGDILEDQLHERYTTTCDPRLNARQAIDLAFRRRRAPAGLSRGASHPGASEARARTPTASARVGPGRRRCPERGRCFAPFSP